VEVPVEVPVEVKPSSSEPKIRKDAVFTVNVDLPNKSFSFVLVKGSVYSHTTADKMNPTDVKRLIADGLKPLLGGMT
jgi:hypothetical protein